MRIPRTGLALILVFSTALAAAGFVIFRQAARLARVESRHNQDLVSLAKLQSALSEQQKRVNSPASVVPGPASQGECPPSSAAATSASAADAAALDRVKRELDEAHAAAARLQGQLEASRQEQQNAVNAAADELQRTKQDWRSRLDALQQQLDSARAEAQAARERAAALDADNARIKTGTAADSSRMAELQKTMAGLQDVERRRDAYLNSILRRYRDITDQLRSMTSTLDASRGSEAAPFNGIALSRVQNTIALAVDDLRRLTEVNAQAHQLENKLAKN